MFEKEYIVNELNVRHMRSLVASKAAKTVFFSHSSKDKLFVRHVYSDVKCGGHDAWLDENEISVGDLIVLKINGGLAKADAVILFVSHAASQSYWVQKEWQSALSVAITGGKVKLLPALIEDCELPPILADLKFADFRKSYAEGLKSLLDALR